MTDVPFVEPQGLPLPEPVASPPQCDLQLMRRKVLFDPTVHLEEHGVQGIDTKSELQAP